MSDDLIERVARAIYEEDDLWHTVWPWPDLQSDQTSVGQYRRIAQAAIAAIDLPGQREAAARAALEAAATVAPSKTPSGECETVGQWTRRTLREAIRAIDPAAFRGGSHE